MLKTFAIASLILAVLLFTLPTTPVLASAPIFFSQSNELFAGAVWPQATVGQFSHIILQAAIQKGSNAAKGENLPTDIFIQAQCFCPNGEVFGHSSANVFQITGLNSATLSPVTMNVCLAEDQSGNCMQTAPLTIQATWTGIGPTFSSPTSETFGSPPHKGVIVITGIQRQATVTASLNGQNLGTECAFCASLGEGNLLISEH